MITPCAWYLQEDPWEALEVAIHREAVKVDVGTVNGRVSVLLVGLVKAQHPACCRWRDLLTLQAVLTCQQHWPGADVQQWH